MCQLKQLLAVPWLHKPCGGVLVLLLAWAVSFASGAASACPICGVPTVTLAERYARADAALLVEWVAVRGAQGKTPESTTFEIVQVQRDPGKTYKPGARIEVATFTQGKSGNLYF